MRRVTGLASVRLRKLPRKSSRSSTRKLTQRSRRPTCRRGLHSKGRLWPVVRLLTSKNSSLTRRRSGARSSRLRISSRNDVGRYSIVPVTQLWRGQRPLWVKSRYWGRCDRCPLYPQKRTFVEGVWMSALCQKRTFDTLAYSITSSALACSVSGTVRPSDLAVL